MATMDQSAIAAKLAAPLDKLVTEHGHKLRSMVAGDSGNLSDALKKDENVRKAATFCYPLLPGVVRLVVKEPAFVDFVLNNREKVLGKLASVPAAG